MSTDKSFDLLKHLNSEWDVLRRDQVEWRDHWAQLSRYFDPLSGRYLNGETMAGQEDTGRRKDQYRINGTPSQAMKVYKSAVIEGLMPRTRPWVKLKTSDPYYMGSQKNKEWLYIVENMILDMMEGDRAYPASKIAVGETGYYGSAQMLITEHPTRLAHCHTDTIGQFVWALDEFDEVCASQTQREMSAYAIKNRFSAKEDGSDMPECIKMALKSNQHQRFKIRLAVFKNNMYKFGRLGKSGYTWRGVYYIASSNGEKAILEDKGFYSKPILTIRGAVDGCSVYGRADTMDALGDTKQLQKTTMMATQALGLTMNPPMSAPIGMKQTGIKAYPNAITYRPAGVDADQIAPLFKFDFNLVAAEAHLEKMEARIREALHYNEFLAVLSMDKQATAFEVAKRIEEKITVIGSVLDSYKDDLLAPIVERHFEILKNMKLLPPIPEEMKGAKLKIEYTSVLAQAQKMIGASTFEQALDYRSRKAAIHGESALDIVDSDEETRMYYDMIGMPPQILRSAEELNQIRQEQAQQAQAAQQAQMAAIGAKAAKDASQSKVGDQNLLEAMTGTEA